MATLVVDFQHLFLAGEIPGRVLIGRLPTLGVTLDDVNVSRLHAFIAQEDDSWFIEDCGSRTGTFVNAQRAQNACPLHDGDSIRIGGATLTFHTTDSIPDGAAVIWLAERPPMADVTRAGVLFECFCGAPQFADADQIGQRHVCRHCRRILIVPATPGDVANSVGTDLIIPDEPPPPAAEDQPEIVAEVREEPATPASQAFESSIANEQLAEAAAPPVVVETLAEPAAPTSRLFESANISKPSAPAPAPEVAPRFPPPSPRELPAIPPVADVSSLCSVCQNPIIIGELTHTCPACGLVFHAECWVENRGCSAYGCSQVNILAETGDAEDAAMIAADDADETEGAVAAAAVPRAVDRADAAPSAAADQADSSDGFPWEYAFLFISVLGVLLSVVVFGVPSLIAGIGTSFYASRHGSSRTRAVLTGAVTLCVLGVLGGAATSYYWWFKLQGLRL